MLKTTKYSMLVVVSRFLDSLVILSCDFINHRIWLNKFYRICPSFITSRPLILDVDQHTFLKYCDAYAVCRGFNTDLR